MDTTGKSRLSQFWNHLQHELFPFLREEDHLALSPALEKVIRVLEFTRIERFIPSSRGASGVRRRIEWPWRGPLSPRRCLTCRPPRP